MKRITAGERYRRCGSPRFVCPSQPAPALAHLLLADNTPPVDEADLCGRALPQVFPVMNKGQASSLGGGRGRIRLVKRAGAG